MNEINNNDSFKADYSLYTNMAFHRRGAIINETIMLERLIDTYIADCYCGEGGKQIEMMETLLCTKKLIFENKVQLFKTLLTKYDPHILKANPRLIKDLLEIVIPQRNIFAHYWLDTSKVLSEYVNRRETVFVKFQDTTTHEIYNDNRFEKLMNTINKGIRIIMTMQADPKHMASKNPPSK